MRTEKKYAFKVCNMCREMDNNFRAISLHQELDVFTTKSFMNLATINHTLR